LEKDINISLRVNEIVEGKLRMKSYDTAEIAIIGGTGLESLLEGSKRINVGTPYGFSSPISIGFVSGRKVAFLPRHGPTHSIPPHKVNYRANVYALSKIGVKRIIATNAVGAINLSFKPGDMVIPHDLIDFTKGRPLTFYDGSPVTHIDFTQPYCPEIRDLLVRTARKVCGRVWDRAVYVCTEGPRYETPAEIRMFRILGCDVVGMTGVPEAILARELEMCYATLCFVSNMAAGISGRLTAKEVIKVSKMVIPKVKQILSDVIRHLPEERSCPCAEALKEARVRG